MNMTSSTIAAHNSVKHFLRNVIAYFDQQRCRVMEIFAEDLETDKHSVSPRNGIGLP
jgi:chemotaxis methyl-accepting protein methylase